MLLKVLPDGKFQNMHIPHFPEMALFRTSFDSSSGTSKKDLTVTYKIPKVPLVPFHEDQSRSLKVPLNPKYEDLESINVEMHKSPTSAYKMREEFNSWFSNCFGFPVILAYLGDKARKPLGNISPNFVAKASSAESKSSWLSLSSYLPLPGHFQGVLEDKKASNDNITFADCAQFLIVTMASVADVNPRLREIGSPDSQEQESIEMDVRKLRPNIVLDGEAAWDEDFWGELTIIPAGSTAPLHDDSGIDTEDESVSNGKNENGFSKSPIHMILTANCGRCVSLNVDYATGKPDTGPAGKLLKTLMKDRRVDTGNKYSPVFGRYGFLSSLQEGVDKLSIGDEVMVTKRNEERTVFRKSSDLLHFIIISTTLLSAILSSN